MEYNFKKIGERIKSERKKNGFKSQDSLIEHLSEKCDYPIGRNRYSKIENGDSKGFDFDLIAHLCKIFDCEMGYLLCEYDCKTGRNTDIQNEVGLSESCINKLRVMSNENKATGFTDILTLLIDNDDFLYLLSLIGNSAQGNMNAVSFGNTMILPDRKAIINSELKDTIIKIASDIRKEFKQNEHSFEYNFLFGLYHEGRITLEQMQDIKREYDKGNFDYVPNGMKIGNGKI
ncbi:helix-turn-helix domain-containing protein [Butyrivibrio sp. XPD2002]|uniref:helix-turn-helix domain-containing protein n=1 Tax=Butyrivibrio sp. XPD2002 TaxID=1280665 RepID=UPI0004235749|nr:helix-turn-helix transcriptional regulator [Butyrivibrio sp. XPD2002]